MEEATISPQTPKSYSPASEEAVFTQIEHDSPVILTVNYDSHKKLEVLRAREINFIARVYRITGLISLLASIAVTVLSRTLFSESISIPGFNVEVLLYTFPGYFALVDFILSLGVFLFSFMLLVSFIAILILEHRKKKKQLLDEQVWVILLLLAAVVYFIPYESSIRLRTEFLHKPAPDTDSIISVVFVCLKMSSFSVIYVLYLWFAGHTYGFLDRRVPIRRLMFYVPKIATITIYVVYKLIVLLLYQITFSEVPFATLLGFFSLYGTIGEWPRIGVTTVLILTVMEILLTVIVCRDLLRTFKILKEADYTKYRTKIVGFRFFLHQYTVFNVIFGISYVSLLFGLPNGVQVFQFLLHKLDENGVESSTGGRGSYFDIQYSPFGLLLCVLAFVATEAYTNIPATSSFRELLFPFLKKHYTHTNLQEKPVVYRNREPSSFSSHSQDRRLELHPSFFVMETNISLFNFSWFVYYHGTKKEESLQVDFRAINVDIRNVLYDKRTDTRVIIAETADRIICAFKGTSSTQNIMTDMNVRFVSLQEILHDATPDSEVGKCRLDDLKQSGALRYSKVHAGFSSAYDTIKTGVRTVTKQLKGERDVPIFLTGHSLGGALATLCSIDLCLSQGWEGDRLVVSTFGSPKVGNTPFQVLYDSMIPMHWRVVAGGDLISRIPKVGYRHVGRKVYLSSSGELFIDPSDLDLLFLHHQGPSIVHHRKSCYLLALKAWCSSLGGDYIPAFWPFPISKNDSRKFENTFSRSATSQSSTRPFRSVRRETRTAKLRGFAQAIDALDNSSYSNLALEHWKHLTCRLLAAADGQARGHRG